MIRAIGTSQQAAICQALVGLLGRDFEGLWGADGPREEARQPALDTTDLEPAETAILRLAWDVWNGKGESCSADLLAHLDRDDLAAVGELFIALAEGGATINTWLDRYHPASVKPGQVPELSHTCERCQHWKQTYSTAGEGECYEIATKIGGRCHSAPSEFGCSLWAGRED